MGNCFSYCYHIAAHPAVQVFLFDDVKRTAKSHITGNHTVGLTPGVKTDCFFPVELPYRLLIRVFRSGSPTQPTASRRMAAAHRCQENVGCSQKPFRHLRGIASKSEKKALNLSIQGFFFGAPDKSISETVSKSKSGEAGSIWGRKKDAADVQFSRQALIVARSSRVAMLLRKPRKRNGAASF